MYIKLLVQRETCLAKFLWKRIPESMKEAHPELGRIWDVGRKMWVRDNPGVFSGLKAGVDSVQPT